MLTTLEFSWNLNTLVNENINYVSFNSNGIKKTTYVTTTLQDAQLRTIVNAITLSTSVLPDPARFPIDRSYVTRIRVFQENFSRFDLMSCKRYENTVGYAVYIAAQRIHRWLVKISAKTFTVRPPFAIIVIIILLRVFPAVRRNRLKHTKSAKEKKIWKTIINA